ncbi:MAG: hypothetical protein ACE5G0_22455 [Rhodothermales bacterium]
MTDEQKATSVEQDHRADNEHGALSEASPEGTIPLSTERMMAWIEDNQTLAMLGAFSVGVFIGVMMRD